MKLLCSVTCSVILVLAACTGGDRAARELCDLARFEQQQFNHEHARELYEQVLRQYPDSSSADTARAALSAMPTDNASENRQQSSLR